MNENRFLTLSLLFLPFHFIPKRTLFLLNLPLTLMLISFLFLNYLPHKLSGSYLQEIFDFNQLHNVLEEGLIFIPLVFMFILNSTVSVYQKFRFLRIKENIFSAIENKIYQYKDTFGSKTITNSRELVTIIVAMNFLLRCIFIILGVVLIAFFSKEYFLSLIMTVLSILLFLLLESNLRISGTVRDLSSTRPMELPKRLANKHSMGLEQQVKRAKSNMPFEFAYLVIFSFLLFFWFQLFSLEFIPSSIQLVFKLTVAALIIQSHTNFKVAKNQLLNLVFH